MQILFLVIFFTQNNIFVSITTYKGDLLFWKSFGSLRIKGVKKLSASLLKNFIVSSLQLLNENLAWKLHIKLKGFNKFKKLFTRLLLTFLSSQRILSCEYLCSNAHNGCKLKKKRRL